MFGGRERRASRWPWVRFFIDNGGRGAGRHPRRGAGAEADATSEFRQKGRSEQREEHVKVLVRATVVRQNLQEQIVNGM